MVYTTKSEKRKLVSSGSFFQEIIWTVLEIICVYFSETYTTLFFIFLLHFVYISYIRKRFLF